MLLIDSTKERHPKVILVPYVKAHWDPYEVIGVRKDASLDQIKKAYRELARKLHPDKSNLNDDEAERRFIELNKAWNILKDPERRGRFDHNGQTEDNRHSRGFYGTQQQQNRPNRYHWNQQRGARTFTFFATSDGYLKRKSITAKQYHNDYLKESKLRPFLVFFYSDICPSCSLIENTWTKIIDELAKFNIDSFTINVYQEPRLSHELGVSSIPHIALLIDGQIKPYYEPELSLENIVKFIKSQLPNDLVISLRTESEQDRFIALGPQYNRLSAIIIHNGENLKLRYLLIAYELRQYYRFSQISTKYANYLLLAKKYNLSFEPKSRSTHLLVFDENINSPIINTQFTDVNTDLNQFKRQLIQWPFLQLPRLSSQQRFDDLCLYAIPKEDNQTTTRICIILIATDTPSTLPMRNKLIEFINMNQLSRDQRIVFTFIDPSKQDGFISSLLYETQESYPFHKEESIVSSIIMIQRSREHSRKALHKWLSARWDPKRPDEIDRAKLEMFRLIDSYRKNLWMLEDKVVLGILSDEEGPGLVDKVFWRFVDHMARLIYYLTSRESFSTIIILIFCAWITSLFLYQSPLTAPSGPGEPEFMQNGGNISEQPQPQKQESRVGSQAAQDSFVRNNRAVLDDMKIIELKAETYNGMVRLLNPGFRSIVLLADSATKDRLLPEFKKIVWPYRRNKTLLFGYLCLDRNLDWYKSLLEGILEVSDLNVNKKNCIGTVLSLNGFKKYFRVYHAKHHEIDYYNNHTDNDGSFLGFYDDDDLDGSDIEQNRGSRMQEDEYSVDHLLDRLPIWLDKMFDGLTKRYFLDSWPEEMN